MKIADYNTLVFDCDGVILNSNKVKTEAFYKAALPFGESAAKQLVDYHVMRGGISRYKKFEWFVQNVVADQPGPSLNELLIAYANEVLHGLLTCEIADGLAELRKITKHANWLIVSGGDQRELREVFAKRSLASLFDGGIFGSPDSKDVILSRESILKNIKPNALFLGDSKYDYQAACSAGLDFVFLSGWSEVADWDDWVKKERIKFLPSLAALAANEFF